MRLILHSKRKVEPKEASNTFDLPSSGRAVVAGIFTALSVRFATAVEFETGEVFREGCFFAWHEACTRNLQEALLARCQHYGQVTKGRRIARICGRA